MKISPTEFTKLIQANPDLQVSADAMATTARWAMRGPRCSCCGGWQKRSSTMTTVAEIIQRSRDKLERNREMPGNNCLIYFENLNVGCDVYCGNVMTAQVGNRRGPWKARVYLRLQMDCTAPTLDGALDGLEAIVTEWAEGKDEPRHEEAS